MPINAKANQLEKTIPINQQGPLDGLAPSNTLYRPSPDVIEALVLAQAQQNAAEENPAQSCVDFAKKYTGFGPASWGPGGSYLPLTPFPAVGAVVVFTYTHVAVITAISPTGELSLIEANFAWDGKVSTRTIPANSSTIRGFYHPIPGS